MLSLHFSGRAGLATAVAALALLAGPCGPAAAAAPPAVAATVPVRHTTVGGTELFVNLAAGAYLKENGWETGDGGVSKLEPLPSWQASTAGVTATGRNIPDIALDAALETGYENFEGGASGIAGGTSLASPLFIALQGEINQIQGRRHGWVNPRLYQIVNTVGYVQFRDIGGGIGSPLGWELAGTE